MALSVSLLVFVSLASWPVFVVQGQSRLHYCKLNPLHTLCLQSGQRQETAVLQRPDDRQHLPSVDQRQEREQLHTQEDDKEQQLLVPFKGERSIATDLVPLLKQLDIKVDFIRKSLTSSLMIFLNKLKPQMQSVVFVRTGNGQLTQKDNCTLFSCDLNASPCELMPSSGNWTVGRYSGGLYLVSVLEAGEGTRLSHKAPIPAPASKSISISMSHRLQVEAEGRPEALPPKLEVTLKSPADGELLHEVLGGSVGKWEVSRMYVDQVQSPFFVSISVTPPASGRATAAVGSLKITDGLCCTSGTCP